jgi:hypothetical protein
MIFKDYNRNSLSSILMIIVGLSLSVGMFQMTNFILLYHGLQILVIVYFLLSGIWGLTTPFATINNKELKLLLSITSSKKFDLSQTKIDFDTNNNEISFSSANDNFKLKLKYLKSTDREELIKDLKTVLKPSKQPVANMV